MTKTITQLWYGQLDPSQDLGVGNPEVRQLEKLMQRHTEKIEEKLPEQNKKMIELYNSCVNEYADLLCQEAFCQGFCVGMKLAAEALTASL